MKATNTAWLIGGGSLLSLSGAKCFYRETVKDEPQKALWTEKSGLRPDVGTLKFQQKNGNQDKSTAMARDTGHGE